MCVSPPKIITHDTRILATLKLLKQVARYRSNVLITGESGTGKDLLAKFIHCSGSRKNNPFITIDCRSIPETLFESELYGYEKGAFTGAGSRKIGRLEMAHGGTVYLDQVSEIPPHLQSKITRVIQDQTYQRLGGGDELRLDVHFVASSRVALETKIREGSFREDLFFRLSVVPVSLPPLRERPRDIPLLVKHFLEKLAQQYNLTIPIIHSSALETLCLYPWPGNILELQNVIERLLVISEGKIEITPDILHLPEHDFDLEYLDRLTDQNFSLQDIERYYIRKILQKTRGNKSLAAKILGINRKTLLEKRKRYGLD